MAVTTSSLSSNTTYVVETTPFLAQLLFSDPICMHATLAFTALHLGQLYDSSSSSSSDSQNWIARASVHRKVAIGHILNPSSKPEAQFMTVASLSLYTIYSSLSSSSSPKNIFALITLLHNIWSPMKQLLYTDPWLQGLSSGQAWPSAAPSALDSSAGFTLLHRLYDTSTAFGLGREELDDPDIKGAYRTATVYTLDINQF
uniref:Transcription factor domain-containing protein n=1 Tax=Moniliophthora roreri TaxID=221103 RepID=A0A0W0FSH1_MONRR